jgi:hypothetical protein
VLRKGETKYQSELWTITEVHTNGTVRIQSGNKSERLTSGESSLILRIKNVNTVYKSSICQFK